MFFRDKVTFTLLPADLEALFQKKIGKFRLENFSELHQPPLDLVVAKLPGFWVEVEYPLTQEALRLKVCTALSFVQRLFGIKF